MDRIWPGLECGPGCPQRLCAWVLVASGPTPFYFLTLKVPGAVVKTSDGPTFELLGLDRP